MLSVDSTSGKEREFAENLCNWLEAESISKYEVGDGTLNLLFSWGQPKLLFCTHLDTVPPYISPSIENVSDEEIIIHGRGSCDAKGQIFSMYSACKELANEGLTGFGLLLLSGEETGSFGAKAFDRDCPGYDYLVVGEPTDNCLISACKGTKSFEVKIDGISCHSGYPAMGVSAIERFVDFMNVVRSMEFPIDPILGETTYNVGKLISDNPQNILSPEVNFRIYCRTTFASDPIVNQKITSLSNDYIHITPRGGDTPMKYTLYDGISSKTASFGSDAPVLKKFNHVSICGPGSILVAHTDREIIRQSDIEQAINNYKSIAKQIL